MVAVLLLTTLAATNPYRAYCSLNSVAGAAAVLGKPCDFARQLAKPEFLSTDDGSTAAELASAATACGCAATALEGLAPLDLCVSQVPAILHLRHPGYRQPFRHWSLLLDVCDGTAVLFDGPEGVQEIPFGELLARWDGVAVLAAGDAAALSHDGWRRFAARVAFAFGLFASALATAAVVGRLTRNTGVPGKLAALGTAAAALALAVHAALPWGLTNAEQFQELRTALGDAALPPATLAEALAAGQSPNAALVDCRFAADFAAGALPGAVSLPIDANRDDRRGIQAELAGKHEIVLYCQSAECSFARDAGRELANRGLRGVKVFAGGYAEWQRSKP